MAMSASPQLMENIYSSDYAKHLYDFDVVLSEYDHENENIGDIRPQSEQHDKYESIRVCKYSSVFHPCESRLHHRGPHSQSSPHHHHTSTTSDCSNDDKLHHRHGPQQASHLASYHACLTNGMHNGSLSASSKSFDFSHRGKLQSLPPSPSWDSDDSVCKAKSMCSLPASKDKKRASCHSLPILLSKNKQRKSSSTPALHMSMAHELWYPSTFDGGFQTFGVSERDLNHYIDFLERRVKHAYFGSGVDRDLIKRSKSMSDIDKESMRNLALALEMYSAMYAMR